MPEPAPHLGIDLQDPEVIIDLFKQAAKLNLSHPLRTGSVVNLPAEGSLVITGDLHDHGLNYQRILMAAALHRYPDRHLILHELIHGTPRINNRDMSVRMLGKVAALKVAFPDQVHIMLGNHEIAQLGNEGIIKAGVSLIEDFDAGIDFIFAEDADDVREAMFEFIRSMLLAVRCANGLFISHSLPGEKMLETFDPKVIDRVLTEEDLAIGGDAYHMVWGRRHTETVYETLSKTWDTELFVMGHQPADMGYEQEGDHMLIIASDHNHGVLLPIHLHEKYDIDQLIGQLIPLASITL